MLRLSVAIRAFKKRIRVGGRRVFAPAQEKCIKQVLSLPFDSSPPDANRLTQTKSCMKLILTEAIATMTPLSLSHHGHTQEPFPMVAGLMRGYYVSESA